MKNIKIIVATHKKYKMPNDMMYLPVQVGAEKKESLGYARDNEGQVFIGPGKIWMQSTLDWLIIADIIQ